MSNAKFFPTPVRTGSMSLLATSGAAPLGQHPPTDDGKSMLGYDATEFSSASKVVPPEDMTDVLPELNPQTKTTGAAAAALTDTIMMRRDTFDTLMRTHERLAQSATATIEQLLKRVHQQESKPMEIDTEKPAKPKAAPRKRAASAADGETPATKKTKAAPKADADIVPEASNGTKKSKKEKPTKEEEDDDDEKIKKAEEDLKKRQALVAAKKKAAKEKEAAAAAAAAKSRPASPALIESSSSEDEEEED